MTELYLKNKLSAFKNLIKEAKEIERIIIEIEKVGKSVKAGFIGSKVKSMGIAKPTESTVITMEDAKLKYEKKLNIIYKEIAEIEKLIDYCSDSFLRKILRMRYVEGLNWQFISDNICYDIRHCYRLLNKGIKMILESIERAI